MNTASILPFIHVFDPVINQRIIHSHHPSRHPFRYSAIHHPSIYAYIICPPIHLRVISTSIHPVIWFSSVHLVIYCKGVETAFKVGCQTTSQTALNFHHSIHSTIHHSNCSSIHPPSYLAIHAFICPLIHSPVPEFHLFSCVIEDFKQ